jgi:2-phosphosulfolactate phosphatase
VGALVNASAVAAAVETVVSGSEQGVTVLACGEQQSTSAGDATLRFALEDYLGAGAILSSVALDKSPEAQVCEAAFLGSRDQLQELLWNCVSGWELREKGLADDVTLAASLDRYDTVPAIAGDHLASFGR